LIGETVQRHFGLVSKNEDIVMMLIN